MKNKGLQPKLLYQAWLSFKMAGEIGVSQTKKNTFSPNQHCKRCFGDCFKKMKKKRKRERNTGSKGVKWQ